MDRLIPDLDELGLIQCSVSTRDLELIFGAISGRESPVRCFVQLSALISFSAKMLRLYNTSPVKITVVLYVNIAHV